MNRLHGIVLLACLFFLNYTTHARNSQAKYREVPKGEDKRVCSFWHFPEKKRCAIINPATGECRFTPFVGVMCVTLYEKLSLLIATATLAVNIIFLITR
ncbi:hypothetical protein HMPREF9081_0345 [Centipeda periodontii DSM 2778]|uniref:Uncharacterized protein n=1 Tax=Centipeda periodontii DSM 2778 TaxID=888060 RepID=F5RJB0_9FIRM|nr:hypothetical protein HMPREF9081_0345 [Centipeda periodontii DSM 2778]